MRNEANCEVISQSTEEQGRHGLLHVYLERHGATRYRSAWEEAQETYDSEMEASAGDGSTPRKVQNLGEQAFADAQDGADESWAEAKVTVLLGRDVLTVQYSAQPSSPQRVRQVAVAVATTFLAEL
ncbi:hypothetical protein ACWCQP_49795 [Streptomyces chartreusis]